VDLTPIETLSRSKKNIYADEVDAGVETRYRVTRRNALQAMAQDNFALKKKTLQGILIRNSK
jgi:hypothetical protein